MKLKPRKRLNSPLKPLTLLLCAALLSSCASAPLKSPASVEDRDIVGLDDRLRPFDAEGVILDPLSLRIEELNIRKGDFYLQQAENTEDQDKQINDTLSAAEYYIQAQDYQRVEYAINNIQDVSLTLIQADRLTVVKAYIEYAREEYQESLFRLQPLWQRVDISVIEDDFLNQKKSKKSGFDNAGNEFEIPDAPVLSTQQVDALLLASFNFQALNDYDSALEALIQRERSLYGRARAETTRYIWQIVTTLSEEQRELILQTTQNRLVKNRLEFSFDEQLQEIDQSPQQFNKWREDDINQTPKQIFTGEWNSNSPRQIAVLLPLSSKFNTAATALKDGIMLQHDQNQSPFRPILSFYDIGDQDYQAPQYYAAAVNSGADFIIGPLGKDYANKISFYGGEHVSTLLLGGDTPLNDSTSRFDLSPEMEGQRVAERAWKDGHLSVAIMSDGSNYNQRSADGFSKKWLTLGGKITKKQTFSTAEYDYSPMLEELFKVNQSNYRHTQISRTLGFKPKFTEYKRRDIDFIFMLSNANVARLLRPQISFFSGSTVPVYASSKVFNGIQDTINNIDLDKTRFPVMPWVLKSSQVTPYAGLLNQLFALGSDAYSVAGNFKQLRNQPNTAFNGHTGQVSIDINGEVVNQPVWATFKNGAVTPIDSLGLDIAPLDELNDGYSINPNVKGNYNGGANRFSNSKTYDSKTWDKDKNTNKNRREPQN